MSSSGHSTRKVFSAGNSLAVVIPPHVADVLNIQLGDYLIWDVSSPPFAVASRAIIPPYVTQPDKFLPPPTMPF